MKTLFRGINPFTSIWLQVQKQFFALFCLIFSFFVPFCHFSPKKHEKAYFNQCSKCVAPNAGQNMQQVIQNICLKRIEKYKWTILFSKSATIIKNCALGAKPYYSATFRYLPEFLTYL